MVTEPLLNFIKSQLKLGTTEQAITNMLLGQGWTQADVNEAFAAAGPAPAAPMSAPPSPTPAPASPVANTISPDASPISPPTTPPVTTFSTPSIPVTPSSKPSLAAAVLAETPAFSGMASFVKNEQPQQAAHSQPEPQPKQPAETMPETPSFTGMPSFTENHMPNSKPVKIQNDRGHGGILWVLIIVVLVAGAGFGIYEYLGMAGSGTQNSATTGSQQTTGTQNVSANPFPTTPLSAIAPSANSSDGSGGISASSASSTSSGSSVSSASSGSTTETWQPAILHETLCWNGFQSTQSCPPNVGTIDIDGNGSVLLGAVEYCQYLEADGTTLSKTPENIWRLPTINELAAELNADPSGFPYIGEAYWSSTAGSSTDQAFYISQTGSSSPAMQSVNKINKFYVRCVQP